MIEIHNGLNTQTHLQSITWSNFNTIKVTVKSPPKPMPDELLDDDLLIVLSFNYSSNVNQINENSKYFRRKMTYFRKEFAICVA
jgi:surface protein